MCIWLMITCLKKHLFYLKIPIRLKKMVWLQDNHNKTGQSEHLPSTNEITKQLNSA